MDTRRRVLHTEGVASAEGPQQEHTAESVGLARQRCVRAAEEAMGSGREEVGDGARACVPGASFTSLPSAPLLVQPWFGPSSPSCRAAVVSFARIYLSD